MSPAFHYQGHWHHLMRASGFIYFSLDHFHYHLDSAVRGSPSVVSHIITNECLAVTEDDSQCAHHKGQRSYSLMKGQWPNPETSSLLCGVLDYTHCWPSSQGIRLLPGLKTRYSVRGKGRKQDVAGGTVRPWYKLSKISSSSEESSRTRSTC